MDGDINGARRPLELPEIREAREIAVASYRSDTGSLSPGPRAVRHEFRVVLDPPGPEPVARVVSGCPQTIIPVGMVTIPSCEKV